MHELPGWIVLWQCLAAMLKVFAHAALALPCIAALTLLAGRREKSRLCAFGSREMALLSLPLAFVWPLLLISDVLLLFALTQGPVRLPENFSPGMPAMLPYSSALVAWLTGVLCLCVQLWRSRPHASPATLSPENRQPHMSAGLCLASALCFFAALALPVCPLAGLPEGLTASQAALAVMSSTLHVYFTCFAPAGALALSALALRPGLMQKWACLQEDEALAARWCALWAMIGYIPYCLDRWGVCLGFALRPGSMPPVISLRVPSLVAISLAVMCWGILFFRRAPRKIYWLNTLGLLLLSLGLCLPFASALWR